MEVKVIEMGCEKVDVHSATAGHLQNSAAVFGKLFLQYAQDGVTVAVAGPSHIFTQRVRIQGWFSIAHDGLLQIY
jgi:hypothetical protein